MSFSPELKYQKATVEKILEQTEIPVDDTVFYLQTIQAVTSKGEPVQLELGTEFQPLSQAQTVAAGQEIIVAESATDPAEVIFIDRYRLDPMIFLSLLFLVVVWLVSRLQGLRAILGIALSLVLLVGVIVPGMLQGINPVAISVLSAITIGGISMYLTHGLGKISHLSFASLVGTLSFVAFLAFGVIQIMGLSGGGSEEAAFLRVGETATLNLQGLLLGGIILGTLGVLDDIVVSQVEVVLQLKKAKPSMKMKELADRALSVGKRHVSSLVNTLVLAYAGTNLPLFLLFSLYNTEPIWVLLNSEMLAEEIIRTLLGSIGLIMSVPITTYLSAWYVSKLSAEELQEEELDHTHGHGYSH